MFLHCHRNSQHLENLEYLIKISPDPEYFFLVLRQINLLHAITSCLFKTNFNIVTPSKFRSSKLIIYFSFSRKNPLIISLLPRASSFLSFLKICTNTKKCRFLTFYSLVFKLNTSFSNNLNIFFAK